jgi:hypothetical protein
MERERRKGGGGEKSGKEGLLMLRRGPLFFSAEGGIGCESDMGVVV